MERRLDIEPWRDETPGESRAEYRDPGRALEVWKEGEMSDGVDLASSGLNWTIMTISC